MRTLTRALSFLATLSLLAASGTSQASIPDLLVTSRLTDEVLRYDGDTGAFLGVFASGGGLSNPVGLTFGPDGHLYVASGNNNRVLRYDGVTGAFLGIFASGNAIASPRNLNFGPDGHLYVALRARAELRAASGDPDGALDDFDRAIDSNPGVARLHADRGVLKSILGDLDGALEDAQEAISLDPQIANAYAGRALGYTILGKDVDAQQDVERAVELGFDHSSLETTIKEAKSRR